MYSESMNANMIDTGKSNRSDVVPMKCWCGCTPTYGEQRQHVDGYIVACPKHRLDAVIEGSREAAFAVWNSKIVNRLHGVELKP